MRKRQICISLLFLMLFTTAIIVLTHYFFHTTANSDKQELIGDMQTISSQIVNFFHTPRRVQGGGGEIRAEDAPQLLRFIRFNGKASIVGSTILLQAETKSFELIVEKNRIKILGKCNRKKGNHVIDVQMIIHFDDEQAKFTIIER